MGFLKKKAFWFAFITASVFITDIWVYFYLKENSKSIAATINPSLEKKSQTKSPQKKITRIDSSKSIHPPKNTSTNMPSDNAPETATSDSRNITTNNFSNLSKNEDSVLFSIRAKSARTAADETDHPSEVQDNSVHQNLIEN
jgi:hypothetical protein